MRRAVEVVDGRKPCGRKTCPEENPQPVDNFSRSSSTKSGYRSVCKTCQRMDRERPEEQERERLRKKIRYDNRDVDLERVKKAEYYQRNRAAILARVSAYDAEHRDEINARFRRYRAEERYRQLDRACSAKTRASQAGVPAESIDLDKLYERDRGTCQLCHRPVDRDLRWPHPGSESLDHKIPIVRGGAHVWDNVQLVHALCNWRKGSKLL